MLDETLARLAVYYNQPGIAELQVTEPGAIWVEKSNGDTERVEDEALSLEYFKRLGRMLANNLDIVGYGQKPYLALSLPGGHRLQLCVGHTVKAGVAMSIRIFQSRKFGLDAYGLTNEQLQMFRDAIHRKLNILISGGMFSGKTTLTNALIAHIPTADRVISVEDTPELDLSHLPNRTEFIVNRLATAEEIDHVEIIKAMMRLRPDRMLIGELSPDNTFMLARILNMGHGGTISTIHADSPLLAFDALIQNAELARYPTEASDKVFRQNIHLVVQVKRDPDTGKRVITDIWTNS
jgi:type IV secretory pathway ATPase VirB11/archaellum biosynthesis ATPase